MTPTREAYKQKLREFNSTEKYKQERDFMLRLVNPVPGLKVLDYGCGLGTLVWDLVGAGIDAYGHDIINYREKDDLMRFRQEYPFKFDEILMIHSIAHIPDIEEKLATLREGLNSGGRVTVITPNQEWLITKDNQISGYKPDPTVIRHFYATNLRDTFEDSGFKVVLQGQFGACCDSDRSNFVHERLFLQATI